MKIIVLVRNYLPMPNAVGVCAQKIINSIKEKQKETPIIVICEKNDLEQSDYETIDNVEVFRFLTKETKERLILARKEVGSSSASKIHYYIKKATQKAKYYCKDICNRVTLKPELVKMFLKKLRELSICKGDIVIPFSAPFEGVMAAIDYVEEHKDIVLIPVLYDLFSDCPYLHRNRLIKYIRRKENKAIEKRMCGVSKRILCPEYWLHSLSKFNCENAIRIIDVPLLKIEADYSCSNRELVYCGSFQRKIRKTDYLYSVLEYSLKKNELDIVFHFIGNGINDNRLRKLKAKYPGRVILDSSMPHDRAVEIMQKSMGLIVVGNERNNQTPSKVFECISLLKPIIYFTKLSNTDIVEKYLTDYPRSFVFARRKSLSEQYTKFCEFLSNIEGGNDPHISKETIVNKFIKATPSYSAELIINSNGGKQ